jgi:HPt (histidine-containing phosphotransfer) domain-containing protein
MGSKIEVTQEKQKSLREKERDKWTIEAIESKDFRSYQIAIMHDWLRTLTLLASILIPFFFVLDIFMMPAALLPKFAVYRALSMLITILQRLIVLRTKPGKLSYIHGYLLSLHVGGMIALMTVDLGGFSSSYYAGLNLVIIGVNLLMPWREIHTLFNTLLILFIYIFMNITANRSFEVSVLLNNIFFITATSVLSIGINFVRFRLIKKEFGLLIDLGKARDDLQDRTTSLKSLLDVSGEGFLSFDPEFIISSEYSRECIKIFGKEIEGMMIDELLYKETESRQEFKKGLGLFFSGKTRPDVIFEHLDKTFNISNLTVSAAYRAVHSSRVMMTLTDITEERRIQEESQRENEKWNMMRKVIANRQAFSSFDREAKALFASLSNRTKSYEQILPDIHTLKGNSGFLGFTKTQNSAHAFEEFLVNHIALKEEIHPDEFFKDLMNSFTEEMMVVTSSLGTEFRLDVDTIEVTKSEYLHIEDHIKTYCPDKPIIDSMEEHRKKPFSELFARFPKMSEQIAERLGKRLFPMTITGGAISVIPEDFEELTDSFTHIIRNIVDHGIEFPSEREIKGKPAAGTIVVEIEQSPEEIIFHFSDDGRGIQFDDILKRAKNLGYINDEQNVTNNQLLSFIFRDNFSTSSKISEISGRGVGLAAVRQAVRKVGGHIMVKTWKDRGTIFIIKIPVKKINEE